jgi:hypothetical protein
MRVRVTLYIHYINMSRPGLIYCLRNASMPDLYKIGRTKDIETRLRQLSRATGVPTPFELVVKQWVPDQVKAERSIHQALSKYRYSPDREFFRLETPDLAKISFTSYAMGQGIPVTQMGLDDNQPTTIVPEDSDNGMISTTSLENVGDIAVIQPEKTQWDDQQLLELGANYLIKIGVSEPNDEFQSCHQDLLQLNSVGINYNIPVEITDKISLRTVNPKLGPGQETQINQFVFGIPTGTHLILGKGKQDIWYLAKITGEYQFYPEFVGTNRYPHRRSVEIIGKFPDGTKRSKACLQTLAVIK